MSDCGGFYYLGSPYSKYPEGIDVAWEDVCVEAALLIKNGIHVYSPIAHCHPIAQLGKIDPYDHAIWLPEQQPMMYAAKGLIILKMAGWEESVGLKHEFQYFADTGKPVIYMEPGTVPGELLK